MLLGQAGWNGRHLGTIEMGDGVRVVNFEGIEYKGKGQWYRRGGDTAREQEGEGE
jgi:hypothetical protein